jgi:hypothetical protein
LGTAWPAASGQNTEKWNHPIRPMSDKVEEHHQSSFLILLTDHQVVVAILQLNTLAVTISCFVQMTNFSVVTTLLLCLACASNSYKFLGSFSLKTSRICQSQSALSSSPERPRSSEPRKWEIKNKDSGAPQGGAGQSGEKDWKSGYVFNKHTQKKRRNDPWWMREEESNNPRILPAYKPWWVTDNVIVDDSWKVADLRAEAAKRGKFIFESKFS